MTDVTCSARKMIEMPVGSEYATVPHIRNHNCTLQKKVMSDFEFKKKWTER